MKLFNKLFQTKFNGESIDCQMREEDLYEKLKKEAAQQIQQTYMMP